MLWLAKTGVKNYLVLMRVADFVGQISQLTPAIGW